MGNRSFDYFGTLYDKDEVTVYGETVQDFINSVTTKVTSPKDVRMQQHCRCDGT